MLVRLVAHYFGLPHQAVRTPLLQVAGRLLSLDMQGLDTRSALALFRKFSGMDTPPGGLEQLEATIVQRCNGVPLALKIAGANLQQLEPNKQEWEVGVAILPAGCVVA
jgi:hypothetical protein